MTAPRSKSTAAIVTTKTTRLIHDGISGSTSSSLSLASSSVYFKCFHVTFLLGITLLLSVPLLSNVQQLVLLLSNTYTDSSIVIHQQQSINICNDDNANTNDAENDPIDWALIEQHQQKQRQIVQCTDEYERIKYNQTKGIKVDDYERSRAYYGNRRRLSLFLQKLQTSHTTAATTTRPKPVNVVVCGGSITIGHGVEPKEARYANRFVDFLNDYYPLPNNQKHKLHMKVAHGANICSMAKRLDRIELPQVPDLFILEFAVNDYEGQDDILWVDHKTDVFFDGFERLATCAEAVVYKLLTRYPNAAIVFFEFRSAVLYRKTAQLLHTGVAQHYQIPIISYADAIYPNYFNLLRQLNSTSCYSVPVGKTIQPYPFGCIPECDASKISIDPVECYSVWDHMVAKHPGDESTCNSTHLQQQFPTEQRIPCYLSFIIHDSVHPSYIGHQLARDLLIEMIAVTSRDLCYTKNSSTSTELSPMIPIDNSARLHLPKPFGFLASPDSLSKHTDYLMVNDTMYTFGMQDELVPSRKSDGFTLYGDGAGGRKGLICTKKNGGEFLEFDIDLPLGECYVIYVAALKSYTKMGKFTISLSDTTTNNITTIDVDGRWKPQISVPSDIQINSDNKNEDGSCTGKCTVRITTHAMIPGRAGNKVKIMSLSARRCVVSGTASSTSNVNKYNLDDPSLWLVV